jgi:SP family galactose:H+ symporter-like MFS transporter
VVAEQQTGNWSPALVLVLVVVLLSGALFGYDQGVISGALEGIQRSLKLSPTLVEVVTSWVTLGALAGSLAGGEIADRMGRRKALLAAAGLFAAGAAVEALAPNVTVLVFGRLVVGFGVGVAAVGAPLYAAELAPPEHRGRFVAAYQLAITIGIFLAYLIDQALASDREWRIMLGVSAVPALLLLVAILPAVESPRWLVRMGQRDRARDSIVRARPSVDPDVRLKSIEDSLRDEPPNASWSEVFAPAWRRPLTIGIGLAVFQQITGINAVIYYSDRIFAAAGFSSPQAQTMATTWAIGAVNVLATLIAIAFIDKLGRRPLLLAGLAGMCVSLVAVGLAFFSAGKGAMSSTAGMVTLVALILFIVSFAFSLGPVVWTVINEIFPGRVRGRAVAVATAVNWGAAFLVSEFFITLVDAIGEAGTFALFAIFCVAGGVWVYHRVPETKGRSLEQIEALWDTPAAPVVTTTPRNAT